MLFLSLLYISMVIGVNSINIFEYLGRLGDFFVLYESVSDRLTMVQTEQLALVPVWKDSRKDTILNGAKATTSFRDPEWTSEANKPVTGAGPSAETAAAELAANPVSITSTSSDPRDPVQTDGI